MPPRYGARRLRRSICFKQARPKAIAGLEGKFALVVPALRHLGKESVGPRAIETLRAALSPAEGRKLAKDTRFGVDWIYEVAKQIAEKAACTGSRGSRSARAEVFAETAGAQVSVFWCDKWPMILRRNCTFVQIATGRLRGSLFQQATQSLRDQVGKSLNISPTQIGKGAALGLWSRGQ